jgi:tetratricopeptide (TPR) repeat protein
MNVSPAHRQESLSPYVGLRPYHSSERYRFFGRDNDASRIAALWTSGRVTVVHGGAGVGKTSLIQAGVIPLLDPIRHRILQVGRVTEQSAFPVAALSEYNPYIHALLSSWAPTEPVSQLARMTISGFLERYQRANQSPIMAAIDHFEEIFRGPTYRQSHRERFFEALIEAIRRQPKLHLLLIVREDYRSDITFNNRLIADAEFHVSGLSRQAAIDAVQRPAVAVGRPFTVDAVREVVDDLFTTKVTDRTLRQVVTQDDELLPTFIQAVCTCLWVALPPHLSTITTSDVRRILNEDECLSEFIFNVLTRISQRYDLDPMQTGAWITRTFVTDDGALLSYADQPDDQESMTSRIVRALEDDHILRSDLRSGSRWRELQSKRLIKPLQLAATSISRMTTSFATVNVADLISNAISSFSEGELDIAERQAKEALQILPTGNPRLQAKVETLLGNIAYQRGNLESSRGFYIRAAELFETMQDNSAVGHLLVAIGQLQMIDREAITAIATLQSAVKRLPAESAVKVELARAFATSGEPRAAIAVLSSALTTDPDTGGGDARILRGEILSDLGDSVGAFRDLEDVSFTRLPSVRAARALTLARLGRLSDAERGIKEALDLGSENGPVLLRAAQFYALLRDAPAAARLAREALAASQPRLSDYQRRQANDLRESMVHDI